MVTTQKSPSVNPKEMKTERELLLEMPYEAVLMKFEQLELSRDDQNPDYNERIASISFRSTINSLEMSMARITLDFGSKGIGLSVQQRCAAHWIEEWYASIPELGEIVRLYDSLLLQVDDAGFGDVGRWIDRSEAFDFVNAVPAKARVQVSSFSTVGKFKSVLTERSKRIGIDVYKLFSIGMGMAISTNTRGWSAGSIEKSFLPEVAHLRQFLQERLWYLQYCEKVVESRHTTKEVL